MGTHYGIRPVANGRPNRRWRTRKFGTPTDSFGTGIFPDGGSTTGVLNKLNPIVLEFKMKFLRNPSDGTIIDLGGSIVGGGLFIRDGGTILRVRCGDGQEVQSYPVTDIPGNRACIFQTTNFPKDGRVHLVTLQLAPSYETLGPLGYNGNAFVAMWIDNVFKGKGEAFNGNDARNKNSFGANTGGFFFANTVPNGETETALNTNLARSNLLYWNNKVVDYGI